MIEIVPLPYDFVNEVPAKSIDGHLEKIGEQIECAWGKAPVFLDLDQIDDTEAMKNGTHPLGFALSECRVRRLHVIPVTGWDRDDSYNDEVVNANRVDNFGVCFRMVDEDFVDLDNRLKSLLSSLGISPEGVDLVLDFKHVGDEKTTVIALISIINSIPFLDQWRTLTFVGSSFPENLSAVSANTIGIVPRIEWSIWELINSKSGTIKRIPSFGDYAIAHPSYVEIDPRLMQMSASIRYSARDVYLLVKGVSVRKLSWSQTKDQCKKIVALPEYSGASFSWGDEYIMNCSKGTASTGNAETWRRVGTNHHLSLAASQISSFVAP
ncbi:Beta protein [Desulfosporosinus lacus DSM 15449]|uniref:Beta protein n=2 Tax=Desulfosporosinus TaxID=79206 RepID=A0A1M5WFT9_9FIRM|nr:Beta protein [Desulfosporosinus lacus DSM 15449]